MRPPALVRALNRPFLGDPFVRKDLRGTWWYESFILFRMIYLSLLGGIVLFVLFVGAGGAFRKDDPRTFAGVSWGVFVGVAYLQLVLVELIATLAGSDMIAREVRGRTLEILYLAPYGPGGIVLGKWKACLLLSLPVIMAAVPIMAAGGFFGALEPGTILITTALLVSEAGAASAVALLVSTFTPVAYRALMIVAALQLIRIFGVCVGSLIPGVGAGRVLEVAGWSHAFWMLGGDFVRPVEGTALPRWLACMGGCVVVTVACLLWTRLRVVRLAVPGGRGRGLLQGGTSFDPWRWFVPRGERGIRTANPLVWKELRFHAGGKFRGLSAGWFVVPGVWVGIALYSGVSWFDPEFYVTTFCILSVLFFLTAAGFGAGAFTREREGGRWDELRVTPLSPRQFILAKAAGAAARLLPLFGLIVLSCIPAAAPYLAKRDPAIWTIALPLLAVLLFGGWTAIVGIWFSLTELSTVRAFMMTLLVSGGMLLALPFILCIGWIIGVMVADAVLPGGNVLGNPEFLAWILKATHPVPWFWYLCPGMPSGPLQTLLPFALYVGTYAGLARLMQRRMIRRFVLFADRSP